MHIIHLDSSRKKAFANGFWRGLGAPAMLYMTHILPKEAEPQFIPVENPASKSDGLRGDWKRVGAQLRAAAEANIPANG